MVLVICNIIIIILLIYICSELCTARLIYTYVMTMVVMFIISHGTEVCCFSFVTDNLTRCNIQPKMVALVPS
jgi:hypothetical protein